MAVSAIQSSSTLEYQASSSQAQALNRERAASVEVGQSASTTRISAYGQIRAAFDRLQSAASALTSPGAFGAHVAVSSNPAVVSAQLSNDTFAGSFKVEVTQLAQRQTLTTSAQSSANTLIGSGERTTVTVEFGTTSGSKFTADESREAKTVRLDASNNTLNGIASAINAADVGVVAAVTFNGNTYQLQLAGEETGKEDSFTVSASGDAVLEKYLSYSPEAASQAVARTSTAQNAEFKVNSTTEESSSNVVGDAIDGVELHLKRVGSAKLEVADNPENVIAQKVSEFVSAFNALQNQLNQAGTGELANEPLVRELKSRVSNALSEANSHAGAFGGLAGIGVRPDGGGFHLETSTFETALAANREAVEKVFTNGGDGFADRFASVSRDLSTATTQTVTKLAEDARSDQYRRLGPASGVSLYSDALGAQYGQLGSLVQSLNQTDGTLSQALESSDGASQSALMNHLNDLANLLNPV